MLHKRSVKAFRDGADWAFGEVIQCFRKPVLDYVRHKLGNSEDSEEVTQEIFLKLFRFRESYDCTRSFSAWLWTIARNTVTDWTRREVWTRQAASVPGRTEELPSTLPDAEFLMLRKTEKKLFRKLLLALTARQRRVLWLRVVHQLSYSEIAERMGISLSAVKCAVYRAKQTLRDFGDLSLVPAMA